VSWDLTKYDGATMRLRAYDLSAASYIALDDVNVRGCVVKKSKDRSGASGRKTENDVRFTLDGSPPLRTKKAYTTVGKEMFVVYDLQAPYHMDRFRLYASAYTASSHGAIALLDRG
jgi:hypothetical protein